MNQRGVLKVVTLAEVCTGRYRQSGSKSLILDLEEVIHGEEHYFQNPGRVYAFSKETCALGCLDRMREYE
jgi:hypothetical protein